MSDLVSDYEYYEWLFPNSGGPLRAEPVDS